MDKVAPIGQSTPVKNRRESIPIIPLVGNVATKLKNPKQCFESEDEDSMDEEGSRLEITKPLPSKGKIRYQKKKPASQKKLFKCDECEKSFESAYIKIHKRNVHFGVKPYSCDKCEKSFSTSAILKSHLVVHSEDRPFPCNECENSFKHKQYLKEHKIRRHVAKTTLIMSEKKLTGLQMPLRIIESLVLIDLFSKTNLAFEKLEICFVY